MDEGQTVVGPVMEQVGFGLTVKTTSSVVLLFAQALVSVTWRRTVAVATAPVTTTVVVNELLVGPVIVAGPETMLQLVEINGLLPGWAVAVIVKVVVAPSEHLV